MSAVMVSSPYRAHKRTKGDKVKNYVQPQRVHMHTFSPRASSFSERLISAVRKFILSHSWKATTMYGVLSSTRAIISWTPNGSGTFSRISSRRPLTYVRMCIHGHRTACMEACDHSTFYIHPN